MEGRQKLGAAGAFLLLLEVSCAQPVAHGTQRECRWSKTLPSACTGSGQS